MTTPLISVLLPAFNAAEHLAPAVDSVLGQGLADFELIVVDDGSTDDTATVIDRFHDPRLIRVANGANLGLVESLNRALALARGEFIARMDADDLCSPMRFQKQVAHLQRHPEVGVLGSWMRVIDDKGRFLWIHELPREHELIAWRLPIEFPIAHGPIMARRRVLRNAGGYDAAFRHIEDIELWSRLIEVTRFENYPEPLYTRRWHPGSVSDLHAARQHELYGVIRRRLIERWMGHAIDDSVAAWLNAAVSGDGAPLDRSQTRRVGAVLVEALEGFMARYRPDPVFGGRLREDLSDRLIRLRDAEGRGRRKRHGVLRRAWWRVVAGLRVKRGP